MAFSIISEAGLGLEPVGSFDDLIRARPDGYGAKYLHRPEFHPTSNLEPVAIGGSDQGYVRALYDEALLAPETELYFFKLNKVFVFPNSGIIFLPQLGAILDISLYSLCGHILNLEWLGERVPGVGVVGSAALTIDPELLARADRIEACSLYPLHSGHSVYGHWWYDCMSAMHSVRDHLRRNNTPLIFDRYFHPRWQTDSVELIDLADLMIFPNSRAVYFEQIIVPSFISISNTKSCSGVTAELFQDIRRQIVPPLPRTPRKRLYISRRSYSSYRWMRNEADVEEALEKVGFAILHPETMSLAQQIEAFSNAEMVVGAAGSGTVNFGFCPDGATLIDTMVKNNIDYAFFRRARALCTRNNQGYGIHCGADASPDSGLAVTSASVDSSLLYAYELNVEELLDVVSTADKAAKSRAA